MTSIFVKIEQGIVADAEAAVVDIEQFFSADVYPIIKSALTYIETNAGSDLLKIASNVFNAAINGLETGTAPAAVAGAIIGTVMDEAKSAGLQIAEGAATLAVSMAAAQINQAANPPKPVEEPQAQAVS